MHSPGYIEPWQVPLLHLGEVPGDARPALNVSELLFSGRCYGSILIFYRYVVEFGINFVPPHMQEEVSLLLEQLRATDAFDRASKYDSLDCVWALQEVELSHLQLWHADVRRQRDLPIDHLASRSLQYYCWRCPETFCRTLKTPFHCWALTLDWNQTASNYPNLCSMKYWPFVARLARCSASAQAARQLVAVRTNYHLPRYTYLEVAFSQFRSINSWLHKQ